MYYNTATSTVYSMHVMPRLHLLSDIRNGHLPHIHHNPCNSPIQISNSTIHGTTVLWSTIFAANTVCVRSNNTVQCRE
jgi:hypothetical protein